MIVRAFTLLLCFCLAMPAWPQVLPDLGDASSASLSEQQEKTIGSRIMRDIRTDPAFLDDPEVTDYVKSLGHRLLGSTDGAGRDIEFFVINEDSINAFALLGGYIGIFTGLIALTQNEAELAGVVSHEIAHITQRHQARAIHGQRTAQWTSLAALALAILAASKSSSSQAGQVTEAAMASASAIAIQSQLDYTREHEREADRVGLVTLDRAGFDPRGMSTFFERLLRANRLAEFKSAPSYLRTHPLTTERIADMQARLDQMNPKLVPDSFEYRIARARVRAGTGSATEAVRAARLQLEDRSVLRPREDVYQLALAQRRAREFDAAWKTLEPLRAAGTAQVPAFELLAAQLQTDLGRNDAALATYKAALANAPQHRGLVYGRLTMLVERGRYNEALEDLNERLRTVSDDWRLYELQARCYGALGRSVARHRAQAESFYRRGNLAAAVDQLEIASRMKGGDFYESSMVEARLRELRTQFETERDAEKALKVS